MLRTSKPLGFIGFPCQNLHSAAAMLTAAAREPPAAGQEQEQKQGQGQRRGGDRASVFYAVH